tara:strand:+ start:466 stop:681 length:216 start_codon:yes stop_codon:yes gene_type:complete
VKKSSTDLIKQFCLIELQVLSDREERLRKEILHCKIQKEYLTQIASELSAEDDVAINFDDLIKIEQQSGDN